MIGFNRNGPVFLKVKLLFNFINHYRDNNSISMIVSVEYVLCQQCFSTTMENSPKIVFSLSKIAW